MAAAPIPLLETVAPALALASAPAPAPASPYAGLRILYSGPSDGTSLQRAESLRALGAEVVHVPSGLVTPRGLAYQLYRAVHKLRKHPDFFRANRRLVREASNASFDIVWIDKGLWLHPATISKLRRLLPGVRVVAYSPDDMSNPNNQSPRYLKTLPLYDLNVTTKSYNVAELEALGAREMLHVDNAYDPAIHRPIELTPADRERYAVDVGFVGAYEAERADMLLRLAQAGLSVCVRGPQWARFFTGSHPNLRVIEGWVDDEAYPRIVNATKINLGFLRKSNRDQQTTRSVEIPACRAFMLAERTPEHERLFREGAEAEFFGDFEELLAKCRHYLANESERAEIAQRGYRRCVLAGYSNFGRLSAILDRALSLEPVREPAASAPRPTLVLQPDAVGA